LGEEEFKCVKLLRNTLDIVKPVDTDDDLDAVEALLKGSNTLLNGLFLQVLRVKKKKSSKEDATMNVAEEDAHPYKRSRVNSNRESSDVGKPTLELDAIGHGRKGENAGAGREEVTCIIVGVEAE
jgi:hypothetical protein